MGRKRKSEFLLQLEKKRDEYLALQSRIVAEFDRLPKVRRDWDNLAFVDWLKRRDAVICPLEDQIGPLSHEVFLGFAQLLAVEPTRANDFAWKVSGLVGEASNDGFARRNKPYRWQSRSLQAAELAMRKAMQAVDALTDAERYQVGVALWMASFQDKKIRDHVRGDSDEWVGILAQLTNAVATAVGTGSARAQKLRTNHNARPVLHFVRGLWHLAREFDVELSYSRTVGVGSGSMMVALNFLKPLLPAGLLDTPPYAAIENLIREEKRSAAQAN
jgi:hypothetical protein